MPVAFEPVFARFDAPLQLLAASSSPHPVGPFAVGFPVEFEAKKGESPCTSRAESAEAVDSGFLFGNFEAEFGQSLGQFPVEPLGFLAVLEGADEIIGEADEVGLAFCLGFDPLFEPQVHHVVQVDVGQNNWCHK